MGEELLEWARIGPIRLSYCVVISDQVFGHFLLTNISELYIVKIGF